MDESIDLITSNQNSDVHYFNQIFFLLYDDENIFLFSLTNSMNFKMLNNLIYIISMTDSVLANMTFLCKAKFYLPASPN